MGSARRLTGNVISLYFLQGLNYAVPMLVFPFLVRTIGLEQYGLIALAQAFAQYFTLLTDYGFNLSATRTIVQIREDVENLSRFTSAVLAIKATAMVIGVPIVIAVVYAFPRFRTDGAFFFAAYLAVIGNVLFPTWLFQGMEQMRYISIVIGVARVLAAACLFLFVRTPSDALLALLIQSGGIVVGGVAGLMIGLVRFNIRLALPTRAQIFEALREGWHLFISTAAVSLYTNTNVVMVGIMAGDIQAGYFSAAEKLIRALQGLLAPVSQALFPHMNSLVTSSKEAAIHFAHKTGALIGSVTFVGSLALFLFAKPIVVLALGHAAISSVPVLRWIAFLPFIIAVSNVLGIQVMLPFGLDKSFSRVLIVAGFVNVTLAYILIRSMGASGAAASVLVTEMGITTAMIFILWKHNLLTVSAEAA